MFGIGGGEMIFIIFIALMLFGSDKIPVIARAMGKGMAQLKNATNEIKSEISKSADEHGINNTIKDLTGSITKEVDGIKGGLNAHDNDLNTTFKNLTSSFQDEVQNVKSGLNANLTDPIEKAKADIEEATGPIKRQL